MTGLGFLPLRGAVLIAISWSAVARTAAAEEPATRGPLVRWSDVEKAVDAHPRVAAGRSEVSAARAGVRAARAAPNPVVDASLGGAESRTGDTRSLEWSVAITVPTSWLARRRANVAQASAAVEATSRDGEALRVEILRELGRRYWAVARTELEVASLGELDRELQALAGVVKARVESGEARPVELTRVVVESEKLAAELAEKQARFESQRRALAIGLGLDPAASFRVGASAEELPVPPDVSAQRGHAAPAQPRLAAARARVRLREAELAQERREWFPDLSLGAFAESELDRRAVGGTLSFELPVFNQNRAGIARAQALLASEQAREAAERSDLTSELALAEAECRGSAEVARRYRDRVLPPARSAADTAEKAYRAGESSAIELIDAKRTYLETRQQAVSAVMQARERCAELAVLLGRPAK